jgi:2-C-methyl-D-erythritol 4-phosphate cytidylyltransferase
MGGRRKPWLLLAGEPILRHALRPFLARPDGVRVIVALSPSDFADPPPWLSGLAPRVGLVAGGTSRTASVRAALDALPEVDLVVVHDAARPLLTDDLLERCLQAARRGGGAVAGHPVVDTLKEVDGTGTVVGTPDRSRLWQAQTPQVFSQSLLRLAYASPDGAGATDDSVLVERAGGKVVMVEASPANLKVTTPDDLLLAEHLLGRSGGP